MSTPTVTTLAANVATLTADTQTVTSNIFIFFCAVLVFFMHTGFAMLECGGVQSKNRQAILIKNVMLIATSAISWWAFGFMFASGSDNANHFIGNNKDLMFLGQDSKDDTSGGNYIGWFFQFAFAATAATIISGAVAERTHFRAYVAYSAVTTAFVYPVVAHWAWIGDGFLKEAGSNHDASKGYIDFAGSGVVHMVGGCAGLVGAILVGPRTYMDDGAGGYIARFDEDGTVNQPAMGASSLPFSTLGTLILWVGWFGFNPGSQWACATAGDLQSIGLVLVNTTLAPAFAAFTYFLIAYARSEPDLGGILNSTLGGLVSITAGCANVEPWSAMVIGIIGAFVYLGSSFGLKYIKIDDVIDASPVHFFCGIWGVLATGLFASPDVAAGAGHKAGLFYGDGEVFAWNLAGIVVITAWTAGITFLFMYPMSLAGMLRISEEEEKLGLDAYMAKHGLLAMTMPESPRSKTAALKVVEGADTKVADPEVVLEVEGEAATPATETPVEPPVGDEKRGCC